MSDDLLTRLRFALYRYGEHIPPCPGRPCACGFLEEWRAAQLPETFQQAYEVSKLRQLPLPAIVLSIPPKDPPDDSQ